MVTPKLGLTRERNGNKSSIIDSTIITVLWYMKLNQMMQKGAWRNQHVSIALIGTCEGLRAENCPSAPLRTEMSKSVRLAADVHPDIQDGVAQCK